ncbi:hypothetical protein SAY86_017749 [Trapa natans]|uniref:Uncharacterized protein n=1 Tax=Trapa natans TaxID=22666 RepID=A0AAN7R6X5_TRANT|nr:hypothetical protein SAY86_017749 [Trapa natans]
MEETGGQIAMAAAAGRTVSGLSATGGTAKAAGQTDGRRLATGAAETGRTAVGLGGGPAATASRMDKSDEVQFGIFYSPNSEVAVSAHGCVSPASPKREKTSGPAKKAAEVAFQGFVDHRLGGNGQALRLR